MKKHRVIVVGGGAAGLMAAGQVAELGAETLLLEKMDQPGRKLRITGKGRCNLTNQGGSIDLVGGQTGRMPDNSTPPVMGNMSDADVQRWLQFNPEAREVLPPLTATAGAAPDVITTEEPPIGEPPPPPPPHPGAPTARPPPPGRRCCSRPRRSCRPRGPRSGSSRRARGRRCRRCGSYFRSGQGSKIHEG